ncbi:Histone deacetylase [Venturia nashicola]|nr:Histone deacetylase [Venturia nashicola]
MLDGAGVYAPWQNIILVQISLAVFTPGQKQQSNAGARLRHRHNANPITGQLSNELDFNISSALDWHRHTYSVSESVTFGKVHARSWTTAHYSSTPFHTEMLVLTTPSRLLGRPPMPIKIARDDPCDNAGYGEPKTNHIRVVHARGLISGTSMGDWVSPPLLRKYRICIYSAALLITGVSTSAQVSLSNYAHTPTSSPEKNPAIMKAALASAILLAVSAVDANKHRLCCCAGIDQEAPGKWSDKTLTCLKDPNKEIVDSSGGKFILSNQLWNYRKDEKYPLNSESFNWYYAADTPADDNWVGGDESAGFCKVKGYVSICFSPKTAEYRNAGTFFKRSQNINQQGDVVVVERDVVERKENSTKTPKHHGAGHHKKKTSTHHKNKTSSHKNKTSTHPKKPKSTASPVQVRDLFKRDLEERKANGTKHAKPHGGHHKSKTSSHHHHKNKTSSHHKNKTSTHHQKPKSTASPVQVRDLFERDVLEERKANGTKHTKSHSSHGKSKTSSHHHHKNKTSSHKNKTSSHKHKTSSHKKPKSTATPVKVRDLFERDAN